MTTRPTITEQGAETIEMPEGGNFGLAVYDEEFADRIVRHVVLLAGDGAFNDRELHDHAEVIWRSANPS